MHSTCFQIMRFVFACYALASLGTSAVFAQQLISRQAAENVGLKRAWFSVAKLDPSRGRLIGAVADGDLLVLTTDQGQIHTMDAETGETKWTARVGSPRYPTFKPAIGEQHIAAVNGSTLYVFDRKEGKPVWEMKIGGAAGAGPCLSKTHVFVPLINGFVEGFDLKEPKKPRWRHQSIGRTLVQPILADKHVLWPTDRGYLYVTNVVGPRIEYRLETEDAITIPPAYLKPYAFSASLDGYLYAFHLGKGDTVWRYSLGDPINSPPVAVMGRVYVASERPEMFALNAKNGDVDWKAKGITHILAVSSNRVYARDRNNRLNILDAKSGTKLGVLDTSASSVLVVNYHTDRVYLASPKGLIQCLHEIEQEKPLNHKPFLDEKNADESDKKAASPADDDDPFGESADAPKDDDPFK